jgi:hypothetical protein
MNVPESPSLAQQRETHLPPTPDAYERFMLALAVSDLLNRLFWPRRRKRPSRGQNEAFPWPATHQARKAEKRLLSGVSL